MDTNLVLHRISGNKSNVSQVNGILVQQALEELGGKVKKQTDLVEKIVTLTGKSTTFCRNMIMAAVNGGQVISEDDPANQKNKIYSLP